MRTARPARRRLLLVLSTWLVGVAVATAVGFGALQMISDRVTDRASPPLSERAVTSSAANEAGSAGGHAVAPRTGHPADPAGTTSPSATNASPTSASPRSAGSPTPSRATPQVQTFPGGVVSVDCQGTKIALRYVVTRDGYSSDVGSRGPEQVEVEFQHRAYHTHIEIRCVAGVPRVTTEPEDDSGSGE